MRVREETQAKVNQLRSLRIYVLLVLRASAGGQRILPQAKNTANEVWNPTVNETAPLD